MKNDLQILQDQITPEILGIFWVTSTKLTTLPRPFHAIDYFLDGLLTNSTTGNSRHKDFFISKSFDQVFFVAHFEDTNADLQKEIKEIMELVKALNTAHKSILIIDENSTKRFQFLGKQYSNFNYKQIELALGESDDISHP